MSETWKALAAAIVGGIDFQSAAFMHIPRGSPAPRKAKKDRTKVKAARKQSKAGKKPR